MFCQTFSDIAYKLIPNKHKPVVNQYLFRAEARVDVVKLKKLLDKEIKLEEWDDEDEGEIGFNSTSSLDELRKLFETVEDGHVMLDTLNYRADFNGERYYNA